MVHPRLVLRRVRTRRQPLLTWACAETSFDVLTLDATASWDTVRAELPPACLQGAFDPKLLVSGTEEEVANTTGIENDNRDAGECGSDEYCVWMVIGGSTVRGFQPGDWTVDLENAETHNTNVNRFVIELQYR